MIERINDRARQEGLEAREVVRKAHEIASRKREEAQGIFLEIKVL